MSQIEDDIAKLWNLDVIVQTNLETFRATKSKLVSKMESYLVDLAENPKKRSRFLFQMFQCLKPKPDNFVCQDVVIEIYTEFFKTQMFKKLENTVTRIDRQDATQVSENKNLIYIKEVIFSDEFKNDVILQNKTERLKTEAKAILACFNGMKSKNLCDSDQNIISKFSFMAFCIKQEKLFLEETSRVLTGSGLMHDLDEARNVVDVIFITGLHVCFWIFEYFLVPLYLYVIAPLYKYAIVPIANVAISPITAVTRSLPTEVNTVAACIWAYYNYKDMLTDPSLLDPSNIKDIKTNSAKFIFKCNCSKIWSLFKKKQPLTTSKSLECAQNMLAIFTQIINSIEDHENTMYIRLYERCKLLKKYIYIYMQKTVDGHYTLECRQDLTNTQNGVDICD